ncbi:MAG: hypothetical protein AAGB51_11540 [Planctomycetota bacterium]
MALITLGGCAGHAPRTTVVTAQEEGLALGASDAAGRALFIYSQRSTLALSNTTHPSETDGVN